MMRSTLGAPLGGTMRGGHHGVESLALSLMTPPNFGGGGGICFPSMVVVALAEPGVPLPCCAFALAATNPRIVRNAARLRPAFPTPFINTLLPHSRQRYDSVGVFAEASAKTSGSLVI